MRTVRLFALPMLLFFATLCLAQDVPNVQLNADNVTGKQLEDLTKKAVTRDYAKAWGTLAKAMDNNNNMQHTKSRLANTKRTKVAVDMRRNRGQMGTTMTIVMVTRRSHTRSNPRNTARTEVADMGKRQSMDTVKDMVNLKKTIK